MAKRMTKAETKGLGLLLIVCVIIAGIGKLLDAIGFVAPSIFGVAAIGTFIWYKNSQKKKRLEYLHLKYGDEAIIRCILQRQFWEGQTSAQLIDSLGNPVSIDKKLLKTRTREIWKYDQRGVNRYGLRIILDDGVVSGWDKKS